jgi:hypothetical protein
MDISDFTISAFGGHVTIFTYLQNQLDMWQVLNTTCGVPQNFIVETMLMNTGL